MALASTDRKRRRQSAPTAIPEPQLLFFAAPAEFRRWLAANHNTARELWVGYFRKATGRPSITWPESVDEALCFGWIDGIRKRVDGDSYKVRFTPRKPTSNWSAVNIGRVEVLTREGRMQPAGLRAFARRVPEKSAVYAYEQAEATAFDAATEKRFRTAKAAWTFFQNQPPFYRKLVTRWIMNAKRAETRASRLEKLIAASAAGRRI